jgi:hypothetical protein
VLVLPVGDGVPNRLDIVDWDGHEVATIRDPGENGVPAKFAGPAPNGAHFVTLDNAVRSLTGETLGAVTGQWMWADDSQHLCELQNVSPSSGVSAEMHYTTLERVPELLGEVHTDTTTISTVPLLGSCSATHNLLSVVFDTIDWTTDVEEYSISPFRLERSIDLTNQQILVSSVSEDGAYMVEEVGLPPAEDGPPAWGPGQASRIVRVSDMAVMATFDGQIAAVSADDQTLVTSTPQNSSETASVEVWALGGSTPMATLAGQLAWLLRRPASGDVFLAVTTGNPGANPLDGARTVIVGADGSLVPVRLA